MKNPKFSLRDEHDFMSLFPEPKDAAEALKLELLLKLIQADFNVWSAFHHVKTPTEGEVRLNDWRVPESAALVKVLMALNRTDE